MDPFAHALLGAALAKTGLGRERPLAMPTLVVAANIADVDVAAYFWSSDAALQFRRGLTHGPIGLAVLPLLVAVAVWLVGRRWARPGAALGPLVGLAYLGALTHPALDWLNTYGVRFLYPFERRWFYGDTLFIVDPWMWLVLGAGVVLGTRAGRRAVIAWTVLGAVAAALVLTAADTTAGKLLWLLGVGVIAALKIAGRPLTDEGRRRAATASTAAFAIYLAAAIGAAAGARAVVLDSIGADRVEALMVGPLPLTPARREVVAVTPIAIRYGRFRWLETPRFEWTRWSSPRLERSAVIDAALADPSIQGFVGWARFPFAEIDEHPDHWEVHLMDARYTLERNARFGSVMVRVPRSPAAGPGVE